MGVNNKFKDLETLKPLIDLKITNLDLDGNEFPEPKDEFRKKVFEMLPSLLLLDGANKDGEEDNSDDEDDDDEDGPGLSALYDNTANLDEDDEADYEGGEAEDSGDDEDEEDDDEEVQQRQGVKRKHDEEDGK